MFGFLAERVGHKLQGWANRDLSKEGKLVFCVNNSKILDVFVFDSTYHL